MQDAHRGDLVESFIGQGSEQYRNIFVCRVDALKKVRHGGFVEDRAIGSDAPVYRGLGIEV